MDQMDRPPGHYSIYCSTLLLLLLLRPWSPGWASVGFLLDYPLFAFRLSSTSCVRSHLVSLPWLFPPSFFIYLSRTRNRILLLPVIDIDATT